jgi:LacI family repressor for deo operon, udp, cdd, tsx, nupC, and nupG
VSFLFDAGHRHIGNIAGADHNIEARERLIGFRDGIAALGLALDEDAIWTGGFRFENGVAAAKRFLALGKRPTAIFAAADDAAIGFIRTVRDAGIGTPEDVSVISFDDIDYARVIDPPLTTMRQPRGELGRLAAADLLARMGRDAPDLPPTRGRLRCELVVRASVRNVDGAAAGGAGKRRARGSRRAAGKAEAPA